MRKNGFTLIEMIVAVGVFTIVSTMAIGALLIMTTVERRVNNNQANQDNIRYAIAFMARDIRLGTGYDAATCGSGCFRFKSQSGNSVVDITYEWSNGAIKRTEAGEFGNITAPEVKITALDFKVFGNNLGDWRQPRVTITMSATSPQGARDAVQLAVQTTVSQITLDK